MTKDLNGNTLSVGTRVRLFSGRDTGTIERIGPKRALVWWDSGRGSGVWPTNCLVVVARDGTDKDPNVLPHGRDPMREWPHA